MAEWLWDDPEGLKQRFELFIRKEVQTECEDQFSHSHLSFGNHNAFIADDNQIAYQLYIVDRSITLGCWRELREKMGKDVLSGELKIGNKIVR